VREQGGGVGAEPGGHPFDLDEVERRDAISETPSETRLGYSQELGQRGRRAVLHGHLCADRGGHVC
jgi:hypothetical protein